MAENDDLITHARLHALTRILGTPTRPFPHAHLYVDDVFPAAFYDKMQDLMPPDVAYKPLSGSDKMDPADYRMRGSFVPDAERLAVLGDDQKAFWQGVFAGLFNQEFVDAILARFRPDIERRLEAEGREWPTVKTDMMLVRDGSSDGVKIHTSAPNNLLTFLFYLPETDRDVDCGTSLYLPKRRDFRSWGGPHYPFAQFDRVWTAPYRPNSLFMFLKTDDSFHGVEPIDRKGIRRDLLLFYLHR